MGLNDAINHVDYSIGGHLYHGEDDDGDGDDGDDDDNPNLVREDKLDPLHTHLVSSISVHPNLDFKHGRFYHEKNTFHGRALLTSNLTSYVSITKFIIYEYNHFIVIPVSHQRW